MGRPHPKRRKLFSVSQVSYSPESILAIPLTSFATSESGGGTKYLPSVGGSPAFRPNTAISVPVGDSASVMKLYPV
jgi:hypothetical protein